MGTHSNFIVLTDISEGKGQEKERDSFRKPIVKTVYYKAGRPLKESSYTSLVNYLEFA